MNKDLLNHILYQDLKHKNFQPVLISKTGEVYRDFQENSFLEFFDRYLKNSALDQESNPFLISTGCGRLAQLEKLVYDEKIQDHLNKNGLSIYLFEDLFIGARTKIKNYLHGPTKNDTQYYEKYQYYIRGFESTPENLDTIYSDELESINDFVLKNSLTNVTVYTCDYNSELYFQKHYKNFKIKTRNLFLITSAKRLTQHSTPEYQNISYKFWCGNVKYRSYRHLVAAYVYDKTSLISLDQTNSIFGSLQNQLWFKLRNWQESNPEIFNTLSRNLLELKKTPRLFYKDSIPLSNYSNYNFLNEPIYENCFCSVVTESRFSQPTAVFSEKTLSAISKYRPFVVVAPPYTLEYLKKYGFKTFSDHWDESYDQEENHERRLIKIFQTIDYINSMTVDELKSLYQDLIPILEHNYLILQDLPYKFYE